MRSSGRSDSLRTSLLPYTRPWNVATFVSMRAAENRRNWTADKLHSSTGLGVNIHDDCHLWTMAPLSTMTGARPGGQQLLTIGRGVLLLGAIAVRRFKSCAGPCCASSFTALFQNTLSASSRLQTAGNCSCDRQLHIGFEHSSVLCSVIRGKHLQIKLSGSRRSVHGQHNKR